MAHAILLLAHLSDIHLAPLPRLPVRAANLKRLLGAANWYRHRRHVHVRTLLDRIVADLQAQRPDHIAVTGDLVNLGLPVEHAAALDWLQMLGPPDRVTVVPGNHDNYVRLRGDTGYRRWDAYMAGDTAGGAFPFVRRRGPVNLIGLGTGVPTRPFVSSGQLGEAQRLALQRRLAEAQQEGRLPVVLLHHPPHRYPQEQRTGLRDAADLVEVLRVGNPGLVLHGHFHRAQLQWIDGSRHRVPVVGVPSASAAIRHKGDLAGYNLFSITQTAAGPPQITLVRRGLAEPDGAIVELERTILSG